MNGLYSSPAATQTLASSRTTLSDPLLQEGVTIFRHTCVLKIPVDSLCQNISLAADARLTAGFSPLNLRIRHDSDAWNNNDWAVDGEHIIVDLVLPVTVASLDSDGYKKAVLYRMDGDHVVEPPVVEKSIGETIAPEFSAARFAVKLQSRRTQPHTGGGSKKIAAAIQAGSTGHETGKSSASSQSQTAQAAMQKMKEQQEALDAWFTTHLDAICINSIATSPRVRLMNTDATETLWQWLEFAGPQSQKRELVITRDTLQAALTRALEQWKKAPSTTGYLCLDLHFESDMPCSLSLDAQQFHFEREADLPIAEAVMRFPGTSNETRQIVLDNPGQFARHLRLTLSNGLDPQSGLTAQAPTPANLLAKTGFRLEAGDSLGSCFSCTQGSFNSGHALPWWPLDEGNAHITLSLHADLSGSPAPIALASCALNVSADAPQWLLFRWTELTLPAGTYWLRLNVNDGSGLWLAGEGKSRILHHQVNHSPESLQVPQTPLQTPLLATNNADATIPIHVSLNGAALSLSPSGEQWLAEFLPGSQGPWQLAVTTAGAGTVTLKRAALVY